MAVIRHPDQLDVMLLQECQTFGTLLDATLSNLIWESGLFFPEYSLQLGAALNVSLLTWQLRLKLYYHVCHAANLFNTANTIISMATILQMRVQ